MSDYAFTEKENRPDDDSLAEKLGPAFEFWTRIKTAVPEICSPTTEEWKFYGKYGWQMKTFLKKRNLFFLIPYESYFKVVFIFGDRAVDAIEKSDVEEGFKNEIRNAKKYGEGRGLAIEVRDGTHIEDFKRLLEIKINN